LEIEKMKKKWSGERLETFIYGDIAVEHLHRYSIASKFVKDKFIVDIASGEGYGSYLLSKVSNKVIGIDIDESSVVNANKKYKKDNLKYLVGSADKIPIESNSIDVVVSFETIEHHDKHEEMLLEIKRILKDDGILIMSSPDKKYYTDIPNKKNPFHVKELYLNEFEALIKNHFKYVDVYFQKSLNNNSIIGSISSFEECDVYSGDYEILIEKELLPLYNIALASDSEIKGVNFSIYDGEIISNRIVENLLTHVRSSKSYILGSILLFPLVKLKNYINTKEFKLK
jgi:ubiquinone/menaquinone biosynthesis C-methylase UbiE